MNDADIVKLAYEIASLWRRQQRDIRVMTFMETALRARLDALEVGTQGNPRRCVCVAIGGVHDVQCPAYGS
jgi:hypothetical protein